MLQVAFVWAVWGFVLVCGFFSFLRQVPEMAKELLENPVLALYRLHDDLHHVRAVTVGVIWKGHQSH